MGGRVYCIGCRPISSLVQWRCIISTMMPYVNTTTHNMPPAPTSSSLSVGHPSPGFTGRHHRHHQRTAAWSASVNNWSAIHIDDTRTVYTAWQIDTSRGASRWRSSTWKLSAENVRGAESKHWTDECYAKSGLASIDGNRPIWSRILMCSVYSLLLTAFGTVPITSDPPLIVRLSGTSNLCVGCAQRCVCA